VAIGRLLGIALTGNLIGASYVALLLLAIGETRASIAGLLIAAFALGGVFYSLSVPVLIARVRERLLMVTGGTLAATALVLIALHFLWAWQIAIYAMFGFGFYLLHSCIQLHVTELSHTARGSAASLHSCSFYMGQAVGPVIYGYGFAHGGAEPQHLRRCCSRDDGRSGLLAAATPPRRIAVGKLDLSVHTFCASRDLKSGACTFRKTGSHPRVKPEGRLFPGMR
jgi:MFS family permease